MSASRWVISVFLLWHLTALAITAVPAPDRLPAQAPVTQLPADPVARRVAPVLHRVAGWLPVLSAPVCRISSPLQRLASKYMNALGLAQDWRMFANPPLTDEYMRLRYYVARDGSPEPSWSALELVEPAYPEYQVRLVQSYRDSYLDKALSVALQSFQQHGRQRAGRQSLTRPLQTPDDLTPIARYFGRRFARANLLPVERVVRTEVWYGVAPNPSPGTELGSEEQRLRVAVLRDYYAGPVQERGTIRGYPSSGATEHEADITWVLEYTEQP